MNYQKVAKRIINQNLFVKEKEMVIIFTGQKSLEFAEALAYEAAIIGAQPSIHYGSHKNALKIYKKINPKFLKNLPKLSDILSRKADVEIIIDESDPFIEKKLPQNKIEVRRKTIKPIRDRMDKRILKKKIKMALVGFPTKEQSQALKIPFNKLNRIFWNTMNVDYKKLGIFNKRLAKKFRNVEKIRIIGEKTDLELSIKGRKPILDSGSWAKEKLGYLNLPAGEVFFAPVENATNGEIYFDLPCLWHYGKQVKGVWFRFKKGKIIDYKIEKGKKEFEDVLKNASGNKWNIAELGIGTNPNARFTGGMTIVDEKIRGTIHMAIGSNKHFGGKGDSTIHWDFFKNMKKGEVLADGKIIMKNGKLKV